jgi:hypothetical protein
MDTTNEGKAEKAFKNFGKKVDEFLADLDDGWRKIPERIQPEIRGFERVG